MNEQQFLTTKDVLGYAEEYITLEENKNLLNYSLSNSLNDIKIAIYARTGLNINLDNAYWELNPKLSISVKHLMNKHRVTYSMTTWREKKLRYIVVNMRIGDKWFFTQFNEMDGRVHNNEKMQIYRKIVNLMNKLNDPDIDIDSLINDLFM